MNEEANEIIKSIGSARIWNTITEVDQEFLERIIELIKKQQICIDKLEDRLSNICNLVELLYFCE